MKIEITEENLRKAHKEGCSDVKRVLETLAPEVFEKKYPYIGKSKMGNIVLFIGKDEGYALNNNNYYVGEYLSTFAENHFTKIAEVKEA